MKEDKYNEKCDECKALGKLCSRPAELYEGVFPPEVLSFYLKKSDKNNS